MKTNWSGVFPAVTTQLKKDQSLDLDATARHIEVLLDSGVHGIIMCGSLGENQTLAPEEKRAVLKRAVEVVAGRVPTLTGIAEMSTAAACQHAADCEALGADGAMVLPPMVYKADPDETLAYFRAVAAATTLPLILYNNPVGYTVDVTPQMLASLSDVENYVAIKESSADTTRITAIQNACGERYALFAGVDTLVPECVAMGATGWIAGVGLAFPRENARIWELLMAGEWEKARQMWRWFLPLMTLDIGPHFVQKIKLALQEVGLGSEWVRAPRLPLVGVEREETLALIRKGIEERPKW